MLEHQVMNKSTVLGNKVLPVSILRFLEKEDTLKYQKDQGSKDEDSEEEKVKSKPLKDMDLRRLSERHHHSTVHERCLKTHCSDINESKFALKSNSVVENLRDMNSTQRLILPQVITQHYDLNPTRNERIIEENELRLNDTSSVKDESVHSVKSSPKQSEEKTKKIRK